MAKMHKALHARVRKNGKVIIIRVKFCSATYNSPECSTVLSSKPTKLKQHDESIIKYEMSQKIQTANFEVHRAKCKHYKGGCLI